MIQSLVLDWNDPSCNTARYDVLSIEPSLFGEITLTNDWSHISWPDQTRIALYENHTVAMEAPETWLQRESRRGYVLRERMGEA
jgi:predicted DNA-binding WGR domain protein